MIDEKTLLKLKPVEFYLFYFLTLRASGGERLDCYPRGVVVNLDASQAATSYRELGSLVNISTTKVKATLDKFVRFKLIEYLTCKHGIKVTINVGSKINIELDNKPEEKKLEIVIGLDDDEEDCIPTV